MARSGRQRGRDSWQMAAAPQHSEAQDVAAASTSNQLACCVCPDTPSFSDVSHLLTHVASKGHLHHEKQIRLKALKDVSAMFLVERYNQWYQENGIELQLFNRMEAKAGKETLRNKRSRGSAISQTRTKKKSRRLESGNTIKSEYEENPVGIPIYPGFFQSDNETEVNDDLSTGDMMTLKGQVWPGMGKMDLANEEMKRTRNQRKPKSVVEKMRRISEGISPTQVVMTPEFDVERVKDVYDEDSPVSDEDEQPPPPRTTQVRRKKKEALANVPVNVPRGERGRSVGSTASNPHKGRYREVPINTPAHLGPFRPTSNLFRNDGYKRGMWETCWPDESSVAYDETNGCEGYAAHFTREQRFTPHDDSLADLNPIAYPSLDSPTPSSRQALRSQGPRDSSRPRFQGHPYFGGEEQSFAPFVAQNGAYDNESSTYQAAAGPFSFPSNFPYYHNEHGQFQLNVNPQVSAKNDYSPEAHEELLGQRHASPFVYGSGTSTNPLLSQNRVYMSPYNQPSPIPQHLAQMTFTPVNQNREAYQTGHDHEHRPNGTGTIKIESTIGGPGDIEQSPDNSEILFSAHSIWPGQGSEDVLSLQQTLDQ